MSNTRTVSDSLGEIAIPKEALFGAQTQRAILNFPISGLTMPPLFIQSLALVKAFAATANKQLNRLDSTIADAIYTAAFKIHQGEYLEQFPIDVFQTGSGTSTNMNLNEVIATLASQQANQTIHPNDHVNLGQSSNDVIPTALHISSAIACHDSLIPQLKHLEHTLEKRADEFSDLVKTGRTHLMDAMPLTLGQELSGFAKQIHKNIDRIEGALLDALRSEN